MVDVLKKKKRKENITINGGDNVVRKGSLYVVDKM
jgi:hypothetical protein